MLDIFDFPQKKTITTAIANDIVVPNNEVIDFKAPL
jgi:hypothetical protein